MLVEHKATTPALGTRREVPLPRVLQWFWWLSIVAFALMFLIAWIEKRAGIPVGTRGPFPDPLFGDLLEYLPTFKLIHTPAFFTAAGRHLVAYPPLGAALFGLLYSFGHPVGFYLTILGIWLLACIWRIALALRAEHLSTWIAVAFPLTLAIVSFPIEGLIQRGNIELFVWIAVALGVWMMHRGQGHAAAVLWGLAAGIKLYPVLLFVLFVRKRHLRQLLLACASFAVATIAATRFLVPDVRMALHRSADSVSGYQGMRSSLWSLHEVAVNHSLFVWFKLLAGFRTDPAKVSRNYLICGAVLFLLAYFGRARKMPLLNQMLVVITFMVLLPPVSYFYTLTNLYAPWFAVAFLSIAAQHRKIRLPGLNTTILLFVPVFASFTLFTFRKIFLFGGLIQSLILLCIILYALQYPFALPAPPMEENPSRA